MLGWLTCQDQPQGPTQRLNREAAAGPLAFAQTPHSLLHSAPPASDPVRHSSLQGVYLIGSKSHWA